MKHTVLVYFEVFAEYLGEAAAKVKARLEGHEIGFNFEVQREASEHISVVLINDSVVSEVFHYTGPRGKIARRAEAKFLDLIRLRLGNELGDISGILDDGYYEFGTGGSVCITWPTMMEK